jgi:hypothetical protein
MLQAIAESKPRAADQIQARWTWRLARATRKLQDRRVATEFPDAKKLLGAVANSRGHRHEENVQRLVAAALTMSREVGAALLASAEGYTPRAQRMLEDAKEKLGTIQEIAAALAENLPAPKTQPSRSRRRRRKKKKDGAAAAETPAEGEAQAETGAEGEQPAEGEEPAAKPKRRRRRRKPAVAAAPEGEPSEPPAETETAA